MKAFSVNYRQNKYRYVTINVDRYTEHILHGRIWHEALKEEVGFGGWMELMMIVNQIYDRTNIPRRTLELRSFEPVAEKNLKWKTSEEDIPSPPKGTKKTFTILLAYRYYASWQGYIHCQEEDKNYAFGSFLELIRVMDCLLKGLAPEQLNLESGPCSCQVAVNGYEDNDMYGEVQNAVNNWRKQFLNAAEMIENVLELYAKPPCSGIDGTRRIINSDTMDFYRKGGSRATFSVRILYQQNKEWQGYIYCRERKEEKAFRSFMEMLYLMASALEDSGTTGSEHNSFGAIDRAYTDMTG